MAILELRGVGYTYPGSPKPAIEDVDVKIEPGEVVGITGPNDAGKSTLCLVAAGLAPRLVGGELRGEVVGAAHAGMVFQDPAAQRSGVAGTVFEEVAFGPVNLGWRVPESIDATRSALLTLDIEELADRHPARLSGGQAQLVAIASALAMRPAVLVLDEPAAQLDPEATDAVVAALDALARAGTAILIAEHRVEVLDALDARRVTLAAGRLATPAPTAGDAT